MSASMTSILKLLTLCALAHSIYAYNLPTASVGPPPPPLPTLTATDLHANLPQTPRQFLIVRGEPTSKEHAEFNAAATSLLKAFREQQQREQRLLIAAKDGETCDDPKNKASFSPYDYTVLLSMLIISLGIGVFYGFFQKSGSSSNEFLLGSEMSLFPVTLSLTTSFITAIELLGNPAEMYFQGTQFVMIVIPMVLVLPVAVKVFYPIYYKMELTSCYEYLGIRFGKEIRIMGALLYVIQMCFYTSVAVLAPAIALSKATGLNTKIAVVLIYVVCVFYSSQGGMKAVVIADTFQAAVLAVSLVLIIGLGSWYSGSPVEIFQTAAERDRLEFFNINPDPTTRHTIWSVVIGGFFYWTSLFCTNQASVQKCMSLKSLKKAKVALGFAITGLVVVFLFNFYTGLMVFNHYKDCDPLSVGRIEASDQLLPFYVMSTFEHIPTIAGIFVAGIFAASLGTVAAALNSLSAVTTEDLIVNGLNIKISPDKGALYAKWMSLGFGLFSFGLVFIVEHLGGVLQATLTLNGLIGGVTLGLFTLGIIFKNANTKGAFYGGLIALAIVIFIGVIAQIANVDPDPLPLSTDKCDCLFNATISAVTGLEGAAANDDGFISWPIFRLSYMWYSMIGCLLTIALGWLISVIINAVQKRNILRITAANYNNSSDSDDKNNNNNNNMGPTTLWKPATTETDAAFEIQLAKEKLGHVNHAINIDDE